MSSSTATVIHIREWSNNFEKVVIDMNEVRHVCADLLSGVDQETGQGEVCPENAIVISIDDISEAVRRVEHLGYQVYEEDKEQ